MKKWTLEDTNAQLSALIHAANTIGPQFIAGNGGEDVVIISRKEFDKMNRQKMSLPEFIRLSPLYDSGIEFKREQGTERGSRQDLIR